MLRLGLGYFVSLQGLVTTNAALPKNSPLRSVAAAVQLARFMACSVAVSEKTEEPRSSVYFSAATNYARSESLTDFEELQ